MKHLCALLRLVLTRTRALHDNHYVTMEWLGRSDQSLPLEACTKLASATYQSIHAQESHGRIAKPNPRQSTPDTTNPQTQGSVSQHLLQEQHRVFLPRALAHTITTPRAGRGEELRPRVELRRRLFTSSHSADGTCTCLVHTERCSSAARINSIIAHFQGLFRSTLRFTQLVHERTHCLDFCRNIGGCQGALLIIVHDWQHKQAGLTRLAAAYHNAVLRKPSWRWRAVSNANYSS